VVLGPGEPGEGEDDRDGGEQTDTHVRPPE
jgi:hypothetical protein